MNKINIQKTNINRYAIIALVISAFGLGLIIAFGVDLAHGQTVDSYFKDVREQVCQTVIDNQTEYNNCMKIGEE